MKRNHPNWYMLSAAVLGLLCPSARASLNLWSSPAELASQPTSGDAWNAVLARANEDQSNPDVGNQDDPTNVRVLASAIVYARTSNTTYKNKVTNAISILVARGDPGDRTLAWARETGAYALAADLVDYQSHAGDSAFRTWLRNMAEVYDDGSQGTLLEMFKARPNNWGAHAFGSLVAIYAYLEDQDRLEEVRDYWIAAVTGPNPGMTYGSDTSWHVDQNNLRWINPAGATKSGLNIDGVIPDDQRRGGSFSTTPGGTGYVWEGQQGFILAARVLDRIGMPIWSVADMALFRAAYRLQVGFAGQFGSQWQASGDDTWMLPFFDAAYGTSWVNGQTGVWNAGKNAGFGYVVLADNGTGTVSAPSFNPPEGTYNTAQQVTISTLTSGASIRYTTNGTTPTSSSGIVYTGPVTINATTTLRAIAYKSGMNDSGVTTGEYTIEPQQVEAPVFNPGPGTYSSNQNVVITTGTSGATIRYTTNGTDPTSSSGIVYSGPVNLSSTTTLKAIAYKSGMDDSNVTSGVYTISPSQVAAPLFDPAAGTYTSAQDVAITSNTSGASIRYTTDGSTPTSSTGTVYSSPVAIASTTTLKAIAYKSGMDDSHVTTGVYTINSGSSPQKFALDSSDVTASDDDGNVPANTLDGNLATRWSAKGDEQWIRYDLGATAVVSYVRIAWYLGDQRVATFDVQVSLDGSNWTNVLADVDSSGSTTALETYDFPDVSARYVRIVGHGNSNSDWNSITETEIWGGGSGGGGGGSFERIAVSDTFVQGGSAGTNFNGTSYLRVKNASGDGNDRWVYLKFDVSGIAGTVDTAVLELTLKALPNGTPAAAHVYSVTSDSWTETGLTWNNKPALGTLIDSATDLDTVSETYAFDVKSFVAAQIAGDGIVTLAIRDDNQVAKAADFHRREDGDTTAPKLKIVTQ